MRHGLTESSDMHTCSCEWIQEPSNEFVQLTSNLAKPPYLGVYVASILGIFLQTSNEFTKVENIAAETGTVGVHQYDLKVGSIIGKNFFLVSENLSW